MRGPDREPDPAAMRGAAPRFVSASEVEATLDFGEAADALAAGLRARRDTTLDPVPRTAVDLPPEASQPAEDGQARELLIMPCHGPEGVGIKLVTIARANPELRGLPRIQGAYVLFTPDGLVPELVIDGGSLTRLRTAAVSALATRLLSREDSRRLVVFGAGVQGEAHVAAVCGERPIEDVVIVGATPTSPRAAALAARLRGIGIQARVGDPSSVAGADIVCTCTPSMGPVFDAALLAPGAHVNAIGSYRPGMCELQPQLLGAGLLVIENEEAALAEAGEILCAIDAGILPAHDFGVELGAILDGHPGRTEPDQITMFKSVGLSVQDLIVARALAGRLGP